MSMPNMTVEIHLARSAQAAAQQSVDLRLELAVHSANEPRDLSWKSASRK